VPIAFMSAACSGFDISTPVTSLEQRRLANLTCLCVAATRIGARPLLDGSLNLHHLEYVVSMLRVYSRDEALGSLNAAPMPGRINNFGSPAL
jgi:hypothetical protein